MTDIASWLRSLNFEILHVVADGNIQRCSRGTLKKTAWYVAWIDPHPFAIAGDWRTGERWEMRREGLTDLQRHARRRQILDKDLKRQRTNELAATQALFMVNASSPATASHPYIAKKQIDSCGARELDGELLLPMHAVHGDDFYLWSLERILPDGAKLFRTGGRITGCFFRIPGNATLLICEGFATGATLHMATGAEVWCAMFAGNLETVVREGCHRFKGRLVIVCADNDAKTAGNPGVTAATRAAKLANLPVAVPELRDGTDFNDLMLEENLEAVRVAVFG